MSVNKMQIIHDSLEAVVLDLQIRLDQLQKTILQNNKYKNNEYIIERVKAQQQIAETIDKYRLEILDGIKTNNMSKIIEYCEKIIQLSVIIKDDVLDLQYYLEQGKDKEIEKNTLH